MPSSSPPVVHGSFTLEREYAQPPGRVFAAFGDATAKARWFMGPPGAWTLLHRAIDVRVGGEEVLEGRLADGTHTRFVARYYVVEADRRLVFAYEMHHGGRHLSVSIATVELVSTAAGGTRLTFVEQAAFLDGSDGTASREEGTAAHLARLAEVVADPTEIVSTRVLPFPRREVYAAFADPARLALFWGPKGFTNTITAYDFRPKGAFLLTMHGPDGASYPNELEVVETALPERIVYDHIGPMHRFLLTITLVDLGPETALLWRMRFDDADEVARILPYVPQANEESFDRLEAHLSAWSG